MQISQPVYHVMSRKTCTMASKKVIPVNITSHKIFILDICTLLDATFFIMCYSYGGGGGAVARIYDFQCSFS